MRSMGRPSAREQRLPSFVRCVLPATWHCPSLQDNRDEEWVLSLSLPFSSGTPRARGSASGLSPSSHSASVPASVAGLSAVRHFVRQVRGVTS